MMATKKSTVRRRPMWLGIGVALLMPKLWADPARREAGGALELAAPAAAQAPAARGSTQPPPLLSTREVQVGLAVRLPRMRQRRVARQASRSAAQQGLAAHQSARVLERPPPLRDPASIPPDLHAELER